MFYKKRRINCNHQHTLFGLYILMKCLDLNLNFVFSVPTFNNLLVVMLFFARYKLGMVIKKSLEAPFIRSRTIANNLR